jgi:four helix bundle protein
VRVRDFKDLVCWQLSNELKCEVFAFTEIGPAARDFKYRDQVRDSSASAASNIAEAFGRFRPRDATRFAEFACASLHETRNHLLDGRQRDYLTQQLFTRPLHLADASLRATKNWMLYLKRCDPNIGRPEE